MGRQIDLDEIRTAWRALRDQAAGAGWRTIPILGGRACPILAGREFPGNEEAILVGFLGVRIPPPESLPQGQGFVVTCPQLGAAARERTWIGLSRQPGGDIDLFGTMTTDVLGTLEGRHATDDSRRFSAFLSRIRSWQEFMRRGLPRVLSPEAELGLVGELHVLNLILESGYPAALAVDSWMGPRRGLHDFAFDAGVIEVKTALVNRGFPAHIGSLAQLDDSVTNPIYLTAVRVAVLPSGTTLPQRIDALREALDVDQAARSDFDSRVIEAGFVDVMRESYIRPFDVRSVGHFSVAGNFPRLTAGSVPRGVTRASYELDLDLVTQAPNQWIDVLRILGVVV